MAAPLDYETRREHEWTLVVRDNVGNSREAIVRLRVLDDNDVPVRFAESSTSPLRIFVDIDDDANDASNMTRRVDDRFVHHFRVLDGDTVSSLPSGNEHEFKSDAEAPLRLDAQTGVLRYGGGGGGGGSDGDDQAEIRSRLVAGELVELTPFSVTATDGLFAATQRVVVVLRPTLRLVAPLRFRSLIHSTTLNNDR